MPMCRCAIGCQHSTHNRLFGCFPGMTSSLAKSKQITGAHFQTFFYNILMFWCSSIFHVIHYIKDIRPAIYFDNQKIIAYHL